MKRPFLAPHYDWIAANGGLEKVEYVHYTGIFGLHSVMILDAPQAQKVLTSDHKSPPQYLKKFQNLSQTIGNGLVTLEGDDWHRHRRLIHPSFQPKFLDQMLNQQVPARVQQLVKCWKQANGREIDLSSHFSLLTLDVIGQVAFHHDFQGMQALEQWANNKDLDQIPDTEDKLVRSLNSALKATPYRFLVSVLGVQRYFDTKMIRLKHNMNIATDEIIRRAKEKIDKERPTKDDKSTSTSTTTAASVKEGKYTAKSILELLLDASFLTDLELRDEVKTFLVAGHETTSTWCHWAAYALTKYPDIQQKLYTEVSKPNALQDVNKLPYLDAFLKEVLRVYPPVGMIIRHTTRTETFGEYQIPAKTRIVIPVHVIHHSPKYWENPDLFSPERWLNTEKPANSHPYAFLPFSAGPRNCIGHRFATTEAKMIMASLVREFKFELSPSLKDQEITMTSFITVRAKPVIKILVKERS